MKSLKEDLIGAVSSLPETANVDDIMYRLYVIDKIRRGQNAIIENQVLSVDELKKEMQSW